MIALLGVAFGLVVFAGGFLVGWLFGYGTKLHKPAASVPFWPPYKFSPQPGRCLSDIVTKGQPPKGYSPAGKVTLPRHLTGGIPQPQIIRKPRPEGDTKSSIAKPAANPS